MEGVLLPRQRNIIAASDVISTDLIIKQLRNFLTLLLLITACSACSSVSKEWYYVPATTHQTVKSREGYFKRVHQQFNIADSSGQNIAAVSTSNGAGVTVLVGPPYLPVLPVGLITIFYKQDVQFIMDLNLAPADGYFMPLAIDSDGYKTTRDSLKAKRIATACPLKTTACYMIVNGTKKVPLRVQEYFMGSTKTHSYRFFADIRFGQVRTLTIVTGNPILDRTLKNITFKRRSTITYDFFAFS